MKETGKFRIESSFNITNRGLVVVGQVIEGNVQIGNSCTFDIGVYRATLKINAIELGNRNERTEYFTGLMFAYKDEEERLAFATLKIKEQVAIITSE